MDLLRTFGEKDIELRAAPMFRLIQDWTPPACHLALFHGSTWLRVGLAASVTLCWGSSGAIAQVKSPSNSPFLLAQSTENSTPYVVLQVNPVTGNDSVADGSDRAPFKTLTQALQFAPPNSIIQLAPGTYSAETGEVFPITLRPRVIIQGNPQNRGQGVMIQGGGWFSGPITARRSITILGGANFSTLTGVTITNPTGYGIQVEFSSPTLTDNTFRGNREGGIVVTGNSAPVIRNNVFTKNETAGVRIQNTAQPTLQENLFEQTGTAILVSDRATPIIAGNRITQNQRAIVLQGQAHPSLGVNVIENNQQNEVVKPLAVIGTPQNGTNSAIAFGTQLPGASVTPPASVPSPAPVVQTPPAPRPVMQATVTVQPPPATQRVLPTAGTTSINNVTAASFPIPGSSAPSVQPAAYNPAPRPIQVVQPNPSAQPARSVSPPAPSNSPESPDVTVVVKKSKARSPIPAPLPATATAVDLNAPQVSSRRPIRTPIPSAAARADIPPATVTPLIPGSEQITPVPIPVPAPESGLVEPAPTKKLSKNSASPPSSLTPEQPGKILPVPSSDIPLGNIGGMPKVYTTGNTSSVKTFPGTLGIANSVAVRYRVVVMATDDTQQNQVRSIVPEAFPITYQGKSVMQAGAFSDRVKDDQLANTFISQGLTASVEEMN